MKIVKDEGTLTNSEVLAVLQDREADKEPVVSKAKPSEIQAYSALVERGALQHTVEQQQACVAALKDFDLLKEEVLQLLNHAPADPLGVFVCLTNDGEDRISEDDYDRIAAVVQKHLAS